ncbi:acetyl-CoA synthetase-like protein [Aspergillus japonicus CBS 114.51]|uniref:Acetyl-CoA synthetase-like protein n=1 Tax=Aspergillus japonicus CBS 114.51 TaxID=1448312 RepID=A0A8T8XH16_ASPJA|nr:acetyl-CoA synthetase-like protein [Aspergillus japonicus CBS 114.51]RAH86622.1 acetyl-CoA synthetase-like protein [Aspergillus japonicus CBS 114.51]
MQRLSSLLENAAHSHGDQGIIFYPDQISDSEKTARVTYRELHRQASANSTKIRQRKRYAPDQIVLLHLGSSNHLDTIIWFWSLIYANCIPAMSTPLPQDQGLRLKHLRHLQTLLQDPVCFTSESRLEDFPTDLTIPLETVEQFQDLDFEYPNESGLAPPTSGGAADMAVLMLTSGSTGPCKAVGLTHQQILCSLNGKCAVFPLQNPIGAFLNWISLDHVGSLIEIHLHALLAGVDQVHVSPSDVIQSPLWFLKLLERHQVARTFAPNFFLAMLAHTLDATAAGSDTFFDLQHLQYVVSGGEANGVGVCARLSAYLSRCGAAENCIVPGFGMTETCAGCIYNLGFPKYDKRHGYDFASLGSCIPGVEMRIASVVPKEVGYLEVRGPIVFAGYFNNPDATVEAFQPGGWFRTGDTGFLDANGCLNLAGRTNDLISINGVKHNALALEVGLEEAQLPGVSPGEVVCFAHRAPGVETEQIYVVYAHSYCTHDMKARYETLTAISHKVSLMTNTKPRVLPLLALERSSLGKISRSKLQSQIALGGYASEQKLDAELLQAHRRAMYRPPRTETEKTIVEVLSSIIPDTTTDGLGATANLFELGLTSLTLVQIQRQLQDQLSLNQPLPLATIMTHPTVQDLAAVCEEATTHEYNPVVTLQPHGTKPPLWLIHPAAGEALVFLNLAHLIRDRPVYAFRARGFHREEPFFTSLDECLTTYHAAMKKIQPKGPYAILGYSYGAMVAFELAKRLEAEGGEVRFLASLNRPPYVSPRLRQVQWSECLVNISFFLGILSREALHRCLDAVRDASRKEALEVVLPHVDHSRMVELGLNDHSLARWIDVAFSLQEIGREYQPDGEVAHMAVFHCDPLDFLKVGKEEWLRRLAAWKEFSREESEYYEVPGEHHSVLDATHVQKFFVMLVKALAAREI